MYPEHHARIAPDRPAVIMGESGQILTYAELDRRSNQLAQLWWSAGLRSGDHVAIFSDNRIEYIEVYWAAMRSGLYLTSVSRFLSQDEVTYIVNDSGAVTVVASSSVGDVASAIIPDTPAVKVRLSIGGPIDGYSDYNVAIGTQPTHPLDAQPRGDMMLYSSGTTGRPKGIKRPLPGTHVSEGHPFNGMVQHLFGMGPDTVYLSPAPLYHSAPLGYCGAVTSLGGTVVMMERFDPAAALELIERYQVTHSQWVPTMFVRMLKLPDDVRTRHDLSSMRCAIHAAAPCPVEVKQQMIDWWGPIVLEYYAGTESNGMTFITSDQWLAHQGSVGTPIMGTLHICDEAGNDQPVGEPGLIYFEREIVPFEYHGDAEKTRSAQHPDHPTWTALGDIGYLDEDGFLYLTDRKSFMIISGGVNIYPQEIENQLAVHPLVLDAAVFGLPDAEMGEYVIAVVQPMSNVVDRDAFCSELTDYLRSRIAGYKIPRLIDLVDELPRSAAGKLFKQRLREQYLANQ